MMEIRKIDWNALNREEMKEMLERVKQDDIKYPLKAKGVYIDGKLINLIE